MDDLEAYQEGMHFFSTLLSTQILGAISPLLVPIVYVVALQFGGHEWDPVGIALTVLTPPVWMTMLWFIERARTGLMPAVSIVFALTYSYTVLLNLQNWDVASARYALSPAVVLGYLGSALVLGIFDWRLIKIGGNLAKASPADQSYLITPGRARGRFKQFWMRLFGIPPIALMLPERWRRWTAIALFMLQMTAFAFCVNVTLFCIFLFLPNIGNNFGFFDTCFRPGVDATQCWFLIPMLPFITLGAFLVEMALLIPLVALLRFVARRFARVSLEQVISQDPRSPILFLRSFRDDQVRLRKPRKLNLLRTVSFGEPRPTLDHILLEEGTPHGPVVAIGAPGARRPFGVARTYVTDDQWRETVADLSKKSMAVLITIDETEGVRWEVQHLLAEKQLPKTLFLIPPRLITAKDVARVLPLTFAEAGKPPPVWIMDVCELLAREQCYCVGCFWKSDGKLEVLTTRRNSYVAYTMAVRKFLIGVATAALEPAA